MGAVNEDTPIMLSDSWEGSGSGNGDETSTDILESEESDHVESTEEEADETWPGESELPPRQPDATQSSSILPKRSTLLTLAMMFNGISIVCKCLADL